MALGATIEILDLRHFAATLLRPVLEAEGELWKERLHWDYRTSAKLLMQYLDNHLLPGYAAIESEQVTGYVFCVYEDTKAVVGDVFARPLHLVDAGAAHSIEETLLRHLLELLVNSPQVERVESQLLLHPSGSHAAAFHAAGFEIYRRLFMVRQLKDQLELPPVHLPPNLELHNWSDDDLAPAARLIAEAYNGHPDSQINDQYRSVQGSVRFLNNIVRYAGCGVFSAQVSHVVTDRSTRDVVALILGSRVSPQSGHITQLCVHPQYRRLGLARLLLDTTAYWFTRQSATEISLTVTEANWEAIDLYLSDGYKCIHTFDAAVWERRRTH
jgi:ribosomal protein S18 acetylase RimI-like enzyme